MMSKQIPLKAGLIYKMLGQAQWGMEVQVATCEIQLTTLKQINGQLLHN
jgi:hypothetical protein